MRAVGVVEFGGPEVLHLIDLPVPDPQPGQIRIRVHAATINPADRNIRTGFWVEPPDAPPYVPGMEVAGVIDAVGAGTATDLRVGEHVMAIVVPYGTHGGYAEQVVVPAASAVPVPEGTSDVEAATIPMNGLTARLALDVLQLSAGDVVGVTGAAGAVGGSAVQLAKASGLRVIADAAEKDKALVAELGADVVVPRGPEFAAQVRSAVPHGVDGLVDGGVVGEAVAAAVRDGGRVSTLRGLDGVGERGVAFLPVMCGAHSEDTHLLDELRRLVDAGRLTPRVARTFDVEDVVAAHREFDKGGIRGRLVLTF